MNSTTSKSSVTTQILLAVVAVALGYLFLFSNAVQIITLCQILCGGVIPVGAASIASFFLAGDYRRIDRYGFALGTLLILVGIIGLIRINDVTANFEIYTGVLSLILGVLILQGTVQMKVLDYPIWVLTLVISLVCLIGAFCVLTGVTAVTARIPDFSSWVLLICGAACLFSMLATWICILLAGKREKKREAEKAAAAQREEEARKAAEEQARREELARREAEEQAKREEMARKAAEEQARREEMARKEAQAREKLEEMARKEAQAPVQDDLPPVETPELVFGEEDPASTGVQ